MASAKTVTGWVFGLNGIEKSQFISRAFEAKEGEKFVGCWNDFVRISCVEVGEDWGEKGVDEQTTQSLLVSRMFIFVVGQKGAVSGAVSLFSRQCREFLRVKPKAHFVVLWPGASRPGKECIDKAFGDISTQMGTRASLDHPTLPEGKLGEKLCLLKSA